MDLSVRFIFPCFHRCGFTFVKSMFDPPGSGLYLSRSPLPLAQYICLYCLAFFRALESHGDCNEYQKLIFDIRGQFRRTTFSFSRTFHKNRTLYNYSTAVVKTFIPEALRAASGSKRHW